MLLYREVISILVEDLQLAGEEEVVRWLGWLDVNSIAVRGHQTISIPGSRYLVWPWQERTARTRVAASTP